MYDDQKAISHTVLVEHLTDIDIYREANSHLLKSRNMESPYILLINDKDIRRIIINFQNEATFMEPIDVEKGNKSRSQSETLKCFIRSTFALGLMGEVVAGCIALGSLPFPSNLVGEDANKAAIQVAKHMNIKEAVLTFQDPIYGKVNFMLNEYDNLYYKCTGLIPGASQAHMWKQIQTGYYRRTGSWYNPSEYHIPVTDQMTPEQKSMAEQFNKAFQQKTQENYPGHPKLLHHSVIAMEWIAISTCVVCVVAVVGYSAHKLYHKKSKNQSEELNETEGLPTESIQSIQSIH